MLLVFRPATANSGHDLSIIVLIKIYNTVPF